MPDLLDELIRANTILDGYVSIHDAIFKFSWRKALPIPGFFKVTDFGAHFRDLGRLASELAVISSVLKAKAGSLEGSHQYTASLLEDVLALREICGQFYEKSQGDLVRSGEVPQPQAGIVGDADKDPAVVGEEAPGPHDR